MASPQPSVCQYQNPIDLVFQSRRRVGRPGRQEKASIESLASLRWVYLRSNARNMRGGAAG